MMRILDACAVIAYLRNEEGADVVENALINENCCIHAINMCEVYKDCLSRGEDQEEADKLLDDLLATGLIIRDDMDPEIWKETAQIKANVRRISYADCFALSLTNRLGGILLSSDHHELDIIDESGLYNICFIR
jgi:PIN domain nuclease of toxin-antitoxin system